MMIFFILQGVIRIAEFYNVFLFFKYSLFPFSPIILLTDVEYGRSQQVIAQRKISKGPTVLPIQARHHGIYLLKFH